MSIIFISILFILFSICNGQQSSEISNTGDCESEIQCSARGVCIINSDDNTWYCKCNDGYTTYPIPNSTSSDDPNNIYCNYEQKQQLVAFLLSFFVGFFAAGRFYAQLWMTAGLKIGLNVGLGCFGMCIVSCVTGVSVSTGMANNSRSGCCAKFMGCVGCCYVFLVSLGIFAWLITDWILFGLNELPDGNGVELKPW